MKTATVPTTLCGSLLMVHSCSFAHRSSPLGRRRTSSQSHGNRHCPPSPRPAHALYNSPRRPLSSALLVAVCVDTREESAPSFAARGGGAEERERGRTELLLEEDAELLAERLGLGHVLLVLRRVLDLLLCARGGEERVSRAAGTANATEPSSRARRRPPLRMAARPKARERRRTETLEDADGRRVVVHPARRLERLLDDWVRRGRGRERSRAARREGREEEGKAERGSVERLCIVRLSWSRSCSRPRASSGNSGRATSRLSRRRAQLPPALP